MSQPHHRRVVVSAVGSGYRSRIVNDRGQQTVSDEPAALGGNGDGFGPFELLGAALASCTVATLRMYARRKQWPLDNITVEVNYQRAGEGDLAADGPDLITRTIRAGDDSLTPQQRTRLGEIASRCPVARALAGATLTIHDTPVQVWQAALID